MLKGLFITGTDTGVGKTTLTGGLMQLLASQGLTVAGYKPVASGADRMASGELQNADAVLLASCSSVQLSYGEVNPYCFEAPIAPSFAAENAGVSIEIETIKRGYENLSAKVDVVIVEGAGGWRVPITAAQLMSEIAIQLQLPVIIVVALKLGCLNHACLTAEAVARDGLKLVGWVANSCEKDYQERERTVRDLQTLVAAPCLGEIPFLPAPQPPDVASRLQAAQLFRALGALEDA